MHAMDLPPSMDREPLHDRRISMQGYRRADGLWDIEGELLDVKSYDYTSSEGIDRKGGEPLHNMKIRLTVDDALVVRAVVAVMPHTPFGECQGAGASLQKLVGATLGRGWRKSIDEAAGGVAGCTHLRELLPPMATTAVQTVSHWKSMQSRARGEDPYASDAPPPQFGQCMAWDFDGPVIGRVAPKFAGYRPASAKIPAVVAAERTRKD